MNCVLLEGGPEPHELCHFRKQPRATYWVVAQREAQSHAKCVQLGKGPEPHKLCCVRDLGPHGLCCVTERPRAT